MKLQAHFPQGSIGAQGRHAAMLALISLFGAAALLLALQSGLLLNNPSFEQQRTSPVMASQISLARRVSLDLHSWSHPIGPWKRFSVAHPLSAAVASSQPFSIGIDARAVFKAFGDAARRHMSADETAAPRLKPRNDRLLLMLMLLRLDTRRG